MFDSTSHSFGTVARGGKTQYPFTITNMYVEDVHIAGVRSSCGCTTPRVVKDTLKTWEKTELLAEFNTRDHYGHKSATITVTFDKPFYAEVQLQVDGYIRTDVVLDPGSLNFGSIDQGTPAELRINVQYAGRDDWRIVDVLSANRHLEADLSETARGNGRVAYDLVVRVKPDAPVGYLNDRLSLVTNDGQNKQHIPVDVEGRVQSDLTISPATLFLGAVKPGQTITKQVVVRAKKAFRVTNVSCPDDCFSFKTNEEAKALHLIPVTFEAPETAGKVTAQIRIETDLGAAQELSAYAEVVPEE
jgi:hypothetical protein